MEAMGFERAEVRRIRRHFDGAFAMLAARDAARLPRSARRRREKLVEKLRAYQARGRFPKNDRFLARVPFFVDTEGTRCAMAHLIEASGHPGLVERVAAARNNALVRELAGDAELEDWLSGHGMTAAEAARIQPSYDPRWPAMDFCQGTPYANLVRGTILEGGRVRVTEVYASEIEVRPGAELPLPPAGTPGDGRSLAAGTSILLTTIPASDVDGGQRLIWRWTGHSESGGQLSRGAITMPLADTKRLLMGTQCLDEVVATLPPQRSQGGEPIDPAPAQNQSSTSGCGKCVSGVEDAAGATDAVGVAAVVVLCGWMRRLHR